MRTNSSFDNIKISDKLDVTIEEAVKKAKRRKSRKISKLAVKFGSAAAAVVLMYVTYNFTIPKVSHEPKEAQKIVNGPDKTVGDVESEKSALGTSNESFLDVYRVKDKGIKNAVKNGFIDSVKQSKLDKGISFNIDDVISDGRRAVILYTLRIETKNSIVSDLKIGNLKIRDSSNNILADYGFNPSSGQYSPNDAPTKNYSTGEIQNSTGWLLNVWGPNGMDTDLLNSKELHGFIDITNLFEEKTIPNKINIGLTRLTEILPNTINGKDGRLINIEGDWSINLSLKEEYNSSTPKVYNNIKCSSPESEFAVDNVKVYPGIVFIKMPTTKLQEGGDEYYLEDEKGERYNQVYAQEKGSSTFMGFESCYFNDTKELKLVIEKLKREAPIPAKNIIPEKMR
ncbi:MAG: DUF4179 domain-containing protein [Bacillota bacterium]|nr:DUF4179 domain-containing protein [Bacillota bacterium]